MPRCKPPSAVLLRTPALDRHSATQSSLALIPVDSTYDSSYKLIAN